MTNEQRELVERLRNSSNSMRHDAADLIEQLAERCERLEAALRAITHVGPLGVDTYKECYTRTQAIVRAALAAADRGVAK